MKKRLVLLLLAAGVLLSGCASMLHNDHVVIKPHTEHLEAAGDLSDLRAENYKQVVDILCEMVDQGASRGVIRLANYKVREEGSTVEQELAQACDEVKLEDPLGAYAVDYIRHEVTYIVSYYEANLYISYRRSQDQIQSVKTVTGKTAIREALQGTLRRLGEETALRINYFSGSEEDLLELVREAYYATPQTALGAPEVQVNLYPKGVEEGPAARRQRLVEILFTYPEEKKRLEQQSAALEEAAQSMGNRLSAMEMDRAAETAYYNLRQNVQYVLRVSGRQISTAYAAIVEGRADSEGLALAYQLYCNEVGMESTVVWGTLNGARHYWNIVRMKGGEYRHVDVTAEGGFALEDLNMVERGYRWDREKYPGCGRQPRPGSEEEPARDGSAWTGSELSPGAVEMLW